MAYSTYCYISLYWKDMQLHPVKHLNVVWQEAEMWMLLVHLCLQVSEKKQTQQQEVIAPCETEQSMVESHTLSSYSNDVNTNGFRLSQGSN